MKLYPEFHFRWIAHVLNLEVQNTMDHMKCSITAIRDTAHATRYSPRKMNQLEDYCKTNKDGNGQNAPIKLSTPRDDV